MAWEILWRAMNPPASILSHTNVCTLYLLVSWLNAIGIARASRIMSHSHTMFIYFLVLVSFKFGNNYSLVYRSVLNRSCPSQIFLEKIIYRCIDVGIHDVRRSVTSKPSQTNDFIIQYEHRLKKIVHSWPYSNIHTRNVSYYYNSPSLYIDSDLTFLLKS